MPVLAEADEQTAELEQACSDLGVGMQITNILRDIGEDIRERNRVYIPKEVLEKFNVQRQDIEELAYSENRVRVTDNIVEMWEYMSSLGQPHYECIKQHIQDFIPEARLATLGAAYIYHGIEDAVRKNNYNCFTERNYTSALNRAKLLRATKKDLQKAESREG